MNALCRGCRTEIDLSASSCPICLRPRDRSEMLEDAKRVREEHAAAKKRPYILLGGLVLLVGAGWGAWFSRGPVLGAFSALHSKASDAMDRASDPKTYAPGAKLPDSGAPPSFGAAPAPGAASSLPAAPVAPAPEPAPAPAPAPAPQKPQDWRLPPPALSAGEGSILLRGWVYDLVTARPVPNAQVRLRDRMSGSFIGLSTDFNGAYEILVPRENSGLVPEAAMSGYRRETLAENDPPWRARGAAARRKAAAQEPDEVLLTFTPRQEEAAVNIVLLPLKR